MPIPPFSFFVSIYHMDVLLKVQLVLVFHSELTLIKCQELTFVRDIFLVNIVQKPFIIRKSLCFVVPNSYFIYLGRVEHLLWNGGFFLLENFASLVKAWFHVLNMNNPYAALKCFPGGIPLRVASLITLKKSVPYYYLTKKNATYVCTT